MGIDPWYDPTCLCCAEKREEELHGRMSPLEQHLYATLKLLVEIGGSRVSLLAEKATEHTRIRGLLDLGEGGEDDAV